MLAASIIFTTLHHGRESQEDGLTNLEPQQFGQPSRTDLVTLVALSHRGVLSRIAHRHSCDMRFQQVVQSGGRGSFFKRDLQISAQPIEKLQDHAGLGLDHAFRHGASDGQKRAV